MSVQVGDEGVIENRDAMQKHVRRVHMQARHYVRSRQPDVDCANVDDTLSSSYP